MKNDKNLNILLYAAVGDAWGACFEYAPKTIIEQKNGTWEYFSHHKHDIGNGRYTDDLQMHLAVAEALVSDKSLTADRFTELFVHAFKRDPREGYAGRFYEFLQAVENAEDFTSRIINNSEKSGGAMRAPCIGILSDHEDVMRISGTQAGVTHNTVAGIAAAQAASLMLHFLLYDKADRSQLPEMLNSHIPVVNWSDYPEKKIGHLGIDSVKAALRAIVTENSLTDILTAIIRCGGDTDTAATIAMAVGSCAKDIDQTIPDTLLDDMEDGAYGRTYIMEMDRKLTEFARKQGAPV
ncbi:MAG: ADP-ribosylglycohydrolase family protein [Methyloligellaceae bacterium]